MRLSFVVIFLFVRSIVAQSISTVLPAQNGLNSFTAYISQFPEFLAELDVGDFTGLSRHSVPHELN
jgi:hypothetical protein